MLRYWGQALAVVLAICATILTGCGETEPKGDEALTNLGDNSCVHGLDGVCDEPTRCALGTDDIDCGQACNAMSGDMAPFLSMACAFRENGLGAQSAQSVAQRVALWSDRVLDAPNDQGGMIPRHYRVYRPSHLSAAQSVPVVLMLPGNRVSHYSLPDYTALEQSAETNGFVLVHVEQPWRERSFSWSWYTDWDWANNAEQNPDVIFLRALIESLSSEENISPEHVYVAGHSRGAAMSVIAALEMPDLIAGAVVQSGFVEYGYFERLVERAAPTRKPKFFFMHGVIDDDVCIDCSPGGRCSITPSRPCGTVASSDALVEALRDKGFDEHLLKYARLENVAHRWQPWLNHVWWAFVHGETIESERTVGVLDRPQGVAAEVHAPALDADPMVNLVEAEIEMGTSVDNMVNRYGDGWYVNEQPSHTKQVASFYLDALEVTTRAYAEFVQYGCGGGCLDPRMPIQINEGAVTVQTDRAQQPISFVSRHEASMFCAWRGKRLPTEAEFERAAMSGLDSPWPWTMEGGPKCAHTNFSYEGGRCSNDTYPTGARPSHVTAEGIFDLAGNVAEWVSDDFQSYPDSTTTLPSNVPLGIVRGGSYLTPRSFLKPKARLPISMRARASDIGFRCARDEATLTPDGVIRGELPVIETYEGESNVEDAVYGRGLEQPRSLIVLGETVWVSTKTGVFVLDGTTEPRLIGDGLVQKWLTDGMAIWGLNLDDGRLCEFTADASDSCLILEGAVDATVATGKVYWTDGNSVFVVEQEQSEMVLTGRVGIHTLRIVNDTFWLGEVTPEGSVFSRVPMSSSMEEPAVLLGPERIPSPLMIANMTPGDGDVIWLTVGFAEQWPYSGLLCRLDPVASRFSCVTHTPPKSQGLNLLDGNVVWMHQFGIATYSGMPPYKNVMTGLSPGGVFIDADSVWVSDVFRGQVVRLSPSL
jgi:formylglycine-generating enzyme required for sulfatase activity/poly(3-hydroxybutyrate) depolymerase